MRYLSFFSLCILNVGAFALDNFYCAQGNGIVRLGMTTDEVRQACGIPQNIETDSSRIVKKEAVTRLSYNNLSKGPVYYWDLNKVYHIFSIPSNQSESNVTVDIMDNKVKSVSLNGNPINGTGACNYKGSTQFTGSPSPTNNEVIAIGDPVEKVMTVCGSPDFQDDTYIETRVPKSDKPELWTYKLDAYNPVYQLTFILGVLKNIDKSS